MLDKGAGRIVQCIGTAQELHFFFFKKMKTSDDFYILAETMRRYGGNFCAKLADAICAADSTNKHKIICAFPEIVRDYGPDSKFAKSN